MMQRRRRRSGISSPSRGRRQAFQDGATQRQERPVSTLRAETQRAARRQQYTARCLSNRTHIFQLKSYLDNIHFDPRSYRGVGPSQRQMRPGRPASAEVSAFAMRSRSANGFTESVRQRPVGVTILVDRRHAWALWRVRAYGPDGSWRTCRDRSPPTRLPGRSRNSVPCAYNTPRSLRTA